MLYRYFLPGPLTEWARAIFSPAYCARADSSSRALAVTDVTGNPPGGESLELFVRLAKPGGYPRGELNVFVLNQQ